MYCDAPEALEALKNMPPPPTGWAGFSRTWPLLAAAAEYTVRNPNGTEIVVWVRGWRGREMHARAMWDADDRFSGSVIEYSFRDAEDDGEVIFCEKVASDSDLADWLMEYGY